MEVVVAGKKEIEENQYKDWRDLKVKFVMMISANKTTEDGQRFRKEILAAMS